jgi:acyl-CoA thioesterase
VEPDPTSTALGIDIDEVTPGRARVRMRITDRMLNAHGLAHGGYVFLLADAAFAYASNSHGPVALAQHAQITFVRPAPAGVELVAEAAERVRSGRTGIYDVTVRTVDGATVAEFRGHSVHLPAPT